MMEESIVKKLSQAMLAAGALTLSASAVWAADIKVGSAGGKGGGGGGGGCAAARGQVAWLVCVLPFLLMLRGRRTQPAPQNRES